MTTVLITGATRGIGRQTARELADRGWTVWLGARDLDRGTGVAAELARDGADVRPVQLDVTSDASVAGAAEVVGADGAALDVLINNAGISGPWVTPEETRPEDFLDCFGVNLLGPVRVTRAFLPLLRRSKDPRIVMVSSGMGSLTVTSDPDRIESTVQSLIYPASKAALNMVTSQYARALPDIRVNAVDPGYTATDLNRHSGQKTVDQGARIVVETAAAPAGGPTGGFYDDRGTVPW